MKAWILVTVALFSLWTSEALAAPSAHFTARKIQGSTCVAPCAVHFDAIGNGQDETVDPVFTREFHSLHFLWTFGDPGKGAWPNSGVDKDTAIGGIAGHLYDTPGTYTATLTVVNPNGESSTHTESVVVVAPDDHFTSDNTFCFANDGNDWSGCPLDCAGGNDNCTVISNWLQAISQGNDCVGQSDCADADAQPRRILLRRGDTFTAQTQTIFSQTGAPALIAPFGTGTDPLIVGQGRNDWGSGWTVTGVDLESGQTILLGSAIDNVTFYSVDATFTQECMTEWASASSGGFGRLHAFIDVNCNGGPNTAYASWPGSDYSLWMGGTFDKNGGTASTLRAIHMQHYLIQHTRWIDAAPGREHWQFRTSEEVVGLSDEEEAARFVLLSDNVIENPASNSFFSVRTCVDSGCNCGEGAPDCGGAGIGAGEIVDLGDFIFERNLFSYSGNAPGARIGVFELQGGDITIRNNVFDMQGALTGDDVRLVVATGEPTQHTGGSTRRDNVQVLNNTIYFDGSPASFSLASNRGNFNGNGCGTGCLARNNLIYAPNHNGTYTPVAPGWQESNNVRITTAGNPFAAAIPEQTLTQKSDFALASSSTTLIDSGYAFSPSVDTNQWVYDDALGLCREGALDIGALELGAEPCNGFPAPVDPDGGAGGGSSGSGGGSNSGGGGSGNGGTPGSGSSSGSGANGSTPGGNDSSGDDSGCAMAPGTAASPSPLCLLLLLLGALGWRRKD